MLILEGTQALDHAAAGACPAPDQTVTVSGFGQLAWGDLNCDGSVDSLDALRLLLALAGTPKAVADCPDIGAHVQAG